MTLSENQKTFFYIIVAFIFSIAVRFIWVEQFSSVEQFKFNNQFMINTNDGYYWAEGARDLVNGFHQEGDLSPIDTAASQLTAFFVKILPFSFETIILYMPVFLSSLLVIPIILVGKSLGKLEVGFIAALLGSIAWSYYNRTMVGYYDTDMLNIVFPSFLLWSLIWAIRTREDKYLIFTSLDIILYRWWYPQSYSLEIAFFTLISLYVIYQYINKEDFKFNLTLLTFMMFAMIYVNGLIKLAIVVSLFIFLKLKKEKFYKVIFYLFGLALILFLFSGGFNPIWGKLKAYVFKDSIIVTDLDELKLHFFTVMQTVREADQIPFNTFANRISGNVIVFILSIIGYIWLMIKRPIMLLGLPLLGLGFLATSGGLRFTIYAVPVLALGIAFLIHEVAELFKNKFLKYTVLVVLTIAVLSPNIKHIIGYRVPTVFTKNEVLVLDKLKHIAKREDYVVSWWDYGYPIRYYADVKTLVDGGKHSGRVNFPVSFSLLSDQKSSANMMRLDVEYTEKRFWIDKKEENLSTDKKTKLESSNIGWMALDYGYKNVNSFLDTLKTDIKLPKKTRDIYLYLPNRMMGILPTVDLFSNLDLQTGNKKYNTFFYISRNFRENLQILDLGQGLRFNKQKATLNIGNNKVPINSLIITKYDKNGKLQVEKKDLNPLANLYMIFMKNYHQILVMDARVFNSTYIQLFVLENYDKKLFEPVIMTPLAKVYKLKI